MDLSLLQVIHRHKATSLHANLLSLGEDPRLAGAFVLDSCQRQLWITAGAKPMEYRGLGFASYQGEEAYRFLLRVATGLESQVRGETEIFGQLKNAWKAFEDSNSPLLAELGPWIQKLFEDTKEIRSIHLQNMGGASYGSLVRKLVRQYETPAGAPILLVGAGQLARKVAPWLSEQELWIWNRSRESLVELTEELRTKGIVNFRIIEGELDEARAWRECAHAVICVPTDVKADARRIRMWKDANPSTPPRSVMHLGTLLEAAGEWSGVAHFHPLDDIFNLQQAHNETRAAQFACAAKACDEKALLRSLAGSPSIPISLPHGWEDLAIFA